ncbi:MAG: hypothetical protein HC945_00815 [Nitrosarchaeum sp.]|nr:hypothetical protein [Nitrosarchaeum sp.]
MAIDEKACIRVEYTGKVKESGEVFDTTSESVAKEVQMHGHSFGPRLICLGMGHWLPALDRAVLGRDVGPFSVSLSADEAFGRKSAKLLQLVPRSLFVAQEVAPVVGLEVDIDGRFGIIKSVTGGRVLVDFNHPLASKDVVYDINIVEIVTDVATKAFAVLSRFGFTKDAVAVEGGVCTLVVPSLERKEEMHRVLAPLLAQTCGIEQVQFKLASPGKDAGKAGHAAHAGHTHVSHEGDRKG